MDVPRLLKQAREAACLSQRELALTAATARSAVAAYEAGRRSPTVARLDRLLAGCGVQVRAALEPLLADVDERVDAMVAACPALDARALSEVAASLDDRVDDAASSRGLTARRGPVTWAFDGPTALALHELAVPPAGTGLAVVLDEAARFWLRAARVVGHNRYGNTFQSWLDGEPDEIRAALQGPCFSMVGVVEVRVVEALPVTVRLHREGLEGPVPVLVVEEVERAHPEYAEVLARWRQRREELARTTGPET